MKIETIKEYLKNKINNSWYVLTKEDYNIDGHFKDCYIKDNDYLVIECEEMNEQKEMTIAYYWDYTLEQLYNIWMEG